MSKFALPLSIFLFGFALSQIPHWITPAEPLSFVVDAKIEQGNFIAIFLNGNFNVSPTRKIKKGVRHQYEFSDITEKIRFVRLDPTDAPQAKVEIYGIRITRGKETLVHYSPSEIAAWGGRANLTAPDTNENRVIYTSTNNDPILSSSIKPFELNSVDRFLMRYGSTPESFALNLLGAMIVLVFFVSMLSYQKPYWLAFLPLFFTPFVWFLLSSIPSWSLDAFSVRESFAGSVGMSGYIGASKSAETFTFMTLSMVCVAAGMGVYFISKWIRHFIPIEPPSAAHGLTNYSKTSWAFLGALSFCYFILSFPALSSALQNLENTVHQVDWDSLAVINWQYSEYLGLIPHKDYWFPYGGLWNQISPFPWHMFRLHIYNTFLFSLFATSVFFLLDGHKGWTLTVLAVILGGSQLGYFVGMFRYIMGVNLLLLYLALRRSQTEKWTAYAFYGLCVGIITSYEVTQAVYASVPVITLFFFDIMKKGADRILILKRHLVSLAVFLLVAAGFFLKLYWQNQLDGFLEFYSQMPYMAASGSIPANMLSWMSLRSDLTSMVFWGTLFLLYWGAYLLAFEREDNRPSRYSDIVFCIGLLAFMVFLKHLVRPHMANQFIFMHTLAITLIIARHAQSLGSGAQQWPSRMIVLSLGVLLGFSASSGAARSFTSLPANRLTSLPADLSVLLEQEQELKRYRDKYFAIETFVQHSKAVRDIYRYLTTQYQSIPRFFVLSEDPYLYIIGKQTPPPFTSVYDGGPVGPQKRSIKWLEQKQPELILWHAESNAFDGVPNILRAPLLYTYVIENYRFEKKVNRFTILKKRIRTEPIDFQYWQKTLGETVDLKYIPTGSSFAETQECRQNEICEDFLKVTVPSTFNEETTTVKIKVADKVFSVQFSLDKALTEYYILLDRLWFWEVAERAGLRPQIESLTGPVHSKVVKRQLSDDLMY